MSWRFWKRRSWIAALAIVVGLLAVEASVAVAGSGPVVTTPATSAVSSAVSSAVGTITTSSGSVVQPTAGLPLASVQGTATKLQATVSSSGHDARSNAATVGTLEAQLVSDAEQAKVCGSAGNRLIILSHAPSTGVVALTDSLGSSAASQQPVLVGRCSASTGRKPLYAVGLSARRNASMSTVSAAPRVVVKPCFEQVSCIESLVEGEADDVANFVGSPSGIVTCTINALRGPQPVNSDSVESGICQIIEQAAYGDYLDIASLGEAEATCVAGQATDPNPGASDPLELGVCGTVGDGVAAANGTVGNVAPTVSEAYQTATTAANSALPTVSNTATTVLNTAASDDQPVYNSAFGIAASAANSVATAAAPTLYSAGQSVDGVELSAENAIYNSVFSPDPPMRPGGDRIWAMNGW